jgi:tetratricopeptide (TPR) repeat protein
MAEAFGQSNTPFVGREDHRQAYQQMLRAGNGPWMLLITGQGGNGKSRLLRQLQAETPDGIQTGLLDFANEYLRTDPLSAAEAVGNCLEPLVDATGFRAFRAFRQEARAGRQRLAEMQLSLRQTITVEAGSQAQGLSQSMNTASAVNEMRKQVERMTTEALLEMARGARGRPLTLLLDTCEWFHEPGSQDVGTWLKDTLPRLRERLGGALRVVAAGREGLERLFPFEGSARHNLLLLTPIELERYLQQLGMEDAITRQAVYAMTRGHPLCASIVAQVWLERPFGPAELPAFQGEFSDLAVTQWVSERVLDRLQPPYDDLARYGVLLRSFDLPLLRAVFSELLDSGDQVFRRLIAYSFIVRLAGGRFAFHDLLRQVQAGYLRRQMPEHWKEYHQRALRFFEPQREEVFGRQFQPADAYYHALALDEQIAGGVWERVVVEASIIGEKDYWSRLLQAAHDSALAPGKLLQATRAFHQGIFFYFAAQWDAALENYQHALALFQQVSYPLGEANTRRAIGDVYRLQDDYAAALEIYHPALALFQQISDHLGEANTLKAIGNVQQFQDNSIAALDCYQRALVLFQQISDHLGEANTLKAIGDVQRFQNDHLAALESYQRALTLHQRIGNRLGEASTHLVIGNVQQLQNKFTAALDSYQRALALFQQIGDHLGEANTRLDIGEIQRLHKEFTAAMENYQHALALFQQVGDRLGEANILKAIGDVHQFQKNFAAALDNYQHALTLFQQVSDHQGEANCFTAMGQIAAQQKQYQEALHYYAMAEHLYQQIIDRYSQTALLYYRSLTHEAMGNHHTAIQNMEAAIRLAQLLQLPQLKEFRLRLLKLRVKSGN